MDSSLYFFALIGRASFDAAVLQMSWRFWFMHNADVLDAAAAVPRHRSVYQASIRFGCSVNISIHFVLLLPRYTKTS